MDTDLPHKIEIVHLREELHETQQLFAKLRGEYAEKCAEAEVMRVKCEQIKSAFEHQVSELHAVIRDLRHQIDIKEQECNIRASDAAAGQTELARAQEQARTAQEVHRREVNGLKEKLFAYEQQLQQLRQELDQQRAVSLQRGNDNCARGREELEPELEPSEVGHRKRPVLSTQDLREDVLVLSRLNAELEEKTGKQTEAIAELTRKLQTLECENTKIVLEKNLGETLYKERLAAITESADTANAEKKKYQEMYEKMASEHYNTTLQCNILAIRLEEKEKSLPRVATLVKSVCVHDSKGIRRLQQQEELPQPQPQQVRYVQPVQQVESRRTDATHAQMVSIPAFSRGPVPVSMPVAVPISVQPYSAHPNYSPMRQSHSSSSPPPPRGAGVKVKTQAGASFVQEVKKTLRMIGKPN